MKTVEKLRIAPIGTIVSVADRTLRIQQGLHGPSEAGSRECSFC